MEDPKLILEQNIRELNDQVPRMNENIATVKANVIQLERQQKRLQGEHNDLVARIKASITQGREDIAESYALRLQSVRTSLDEINSDLEMAKRAYEKAVEVKKAFMRERERKIKEAKDAIRSYERSKAQSKIADAMEQFEVGGLDQTHDEMLERISEKTAKNEARVEMALDSVDTERMRIDEEAEKLQARALISQFKLEMLDTPTQTSSEETGTFNISRDSQAF